MRKNFTKSVCVLAGIILMYVPATGQGKVEIQAIELSALQQGIELRAADDQPQLDSTVCYDPTGEKLWKEISIPIDANSYKLECYSWTGNSWVLNHGACDSYNYSFSDVNYYAMNEDIRIEYPLSNHSKYHYTWTYTNVQNAKVEPVYDANQKLTRLTIGSQYVIEITNNSFGRPVAVNGYNNGNLSYKINYSYHSNNSQCTLAEVHSLNNNGVMSLAYKSESIINDNWQTLSVAGYNSSGNHWKWVLKYDENRILQGIYDYIGVGNSWGLVQYTINYYRNVNIPAIIGIIGFVPVGSNNKGSSTGRFNTRDLDDDWRGSYVKSAELNTGEHGGRLCFAVRLPSGFTLDKTNTRIESDGYGNLDLVTAEQENNIWSFEIKPASTRSVGLRSDNGQYVEVNIAYNVDEKLERGTYDIAIHSIEIQKSNGESIFEPAITVPVQVNRWGVGNEPLNILFPAVYAGNQTIHIQAVNAERIIIYSVMGLKLYETTLQSGLNTINSAQFPQGILFIKGSSGWTKKLITK